MEVYYQEIVLTQGMGVLLFLDKPSHDLNLVSSLLLRAPCLEAVLAYHTVSSKLILTEEQFGWSIQPEP